MLDKIYADYAWEQTAALLAVDSPSGFTTKAAQWVKAAFEIRCASIIGFMPDTLACRECGERGGSFYLDIMDGGITCYGCQQKAQSKYNAIENPHESRIICILSEGAKIAIGYCIYCPLEKIFSFSLSDEDMRVFSTACEQYLVHQLERDFKSLTFYKEVK